MSESWGREGEGGREERRERIREDGGREERLGGRRGERMKGKGKRVHAHG